jgi:hypothetical protein
VTYNLKLAFKILIPIALVILLASDDRNFTLWLVGTWGIIALIGLLINDKTPSGQLTLNIHPALQLLLAIILMVSTIVATNWQTPGQREIIQAGFVLFTLVLYRDGFYWCLRGISNTFRTFITK